MTGGPARPLRLLALGRQGQKDPCVRGASAGRKLVHGALGCLCWGDDHRSWKQAPGPGLLPGGPRVAWLRGPQGALHAASHLTHPVVVTPPLRLPPPAQPHSHGSWGLTGRSLPPGTGPGQELARWEIRPPLGHLPWQGWGQGPSQWAPPPAPQGPHSHHSVMTACPVWLARDRLPMVCNLCRYTKRRELSLPPFHR